MKISQPLLIICICLSIQTCIFIYILSTKHSILTSYSLRKFISQTTNTFNTALPQPSNISLPIPTLPQNNLHTFQTTPQLDMILFTQLSPLNHRTNIHRMLVRPKTRNLPKPKWCITSIITKNSSPSYLNACTITIPLKLEATSIIATSANHDWKTSNEN